jgi:hypothetical protein
MISSRLGEYGCSLTTRANATFSWTSSMRTVVGARLSLGDDDDVAAIDLCDAVALVADRNCGAYPAQYCASAETCTGTISSTSK